MRARVVRRTARLTRYECMHGLALVVSLGACGFQVPDAAPGADAAPARADAGHDAALPVDAPPPGLVCPSRFDVTIAASTSRYRIDRNNATFATHHADCNDDLPGATHLVVFDSDEELAQLSALLAGVPQPLYDSFYVGAVQLRDQGWPDEGWLQFTGGPIPDSHWAPGEPEDDGGFEFNHEQQLAVIVRGLGLADVSGAWAYGAICECDGKPLDATAAAAIP